MTRIHGRNPLSLFATTVSESLDRIVRSGLRETARGARRHTARRRVVSLVEPLEPRSMMAVTPGLPLPVQSLDGTGNNLAHLEWGSTDEQLLRNSPVAYTDGS